MNDIFRDVSRLMPKKLNPVKSLPEIISSMIDILLAHDERLSAAHLDLTVDL